MDTEGSFMYKRASETEVVSLGSDAMGPRTLVRAKQAYFRLSPVAAALFLALGDEYQSEADIEEKTCCMSKAHETELRSRLERFVTVGLVERKGSPLVIHSNTALGHKYLSVRLPLLKTQWVTPLAECTSHLFAGSLVAVLVPALIVANAVMWQRYATVAILWTHWFNGWLFSALLVMNYSGLLWHEFGHLAACSRNRIRHGGIGLALYLIFPAFYAEVSDAWRLQPPGRFAVDAGGIYFSLLGASLWWGIFLLTHVMLFAAAACLYDLVILMSLNPFLRFDGYWLVADALDLPNLMETNWETVKWLLSRLVGLASPPARLSRLTYRRKSAYLLYLLAMTVGSGFGCWVAMFEYLPYLWRTLPPDVSGAIHIVWINGFNLSTLGLWVRLGLHLLPAAGILVLLLRVTRKVWKTRASFALNRRISAGSVAG